MASALWYGSALSGQYSTTAARRIDWVTDNVVVSLHTAAYTPDQDAHDFFNDVTNELSGGNYARQTLGTKTVNLDTSTNTVSLRAADSTFANLTGTFRYAVIWVDTAGASSTDPLIAFVDLGAQSVSATNFVLDWNNTDGIVKIVYD
jgi:hypothetical protein